MMRWKAMARDMKVSGCEASLGAGLCCLCAAALVWVICLNGVCHFAALVWVMVLSSRTI